MKLSLSVRVAEAYHSKREASMSLEGLADLAVSEGYDALCMRASQLGIQTPLEEVKQKSRELSAKGLEVSMATGDFPIPENTDSAPQALRNITPFLDLAEALGTDLLRIGMKTEEDIPWAQRATDEATERGIRLAHQSHTQSLFETVAGSLDVLDRIGREGFGTIYEPANLQACGEDFGAETIKRLEPYMFNVYLQNQKLHADGPDPIATWAMGEVRLGHIPIWEAGGIEFGGVMSALDKVGYDGYVTVHQAFAGLRGPEEAVRESARYLRSLPGLEG